MKPNAKEVIKTAIVSAFTIATALIWKDVITGLIELLVPASEELFYKLIAAVLSTILAIIAIYTILKTESEAEYVLSKIKNKKQEDRYRLKQRI
ncbi:MAG: DUF5654 family protein [Nanoarchaeota archaeon]